MQINLELDTYSESGYDRAPAVLIAALRSAHELFSNKGIHTTGSAESIDNVRITWTATTEDTHQ